MADMSHYNLITIWNMSGETCRIPRSTVYVRVTQTLFIEAPSYQANLIRYAYFSNYHRNKK